VLCNNADVMALEDKACPEGYDIQMKTNHLSHFLLTREILPLLEKATDLRGEARVVNHSSIAREGKKLDAKYLGKNGGNLGGNGASMLFSGARWLRYHQTKLANVVFTLALADR
jgi:NAD(P)-dependent dehydrogenase (short-subunit alcohol dehydrogenase family)